MRGTLDGLKEGAPLIQDMASDTSLRGLVAGLEDGLLGLNAGRLKLDGMAPLLNGASEPIEAALAGKPASFSWRVLTQGHPAAPGDLRGVIEVRPVMDFKSVQPGLESSDALRAIAAEVLPAYQARLRLTGPVAMADEEFGTIKENAARNGIITGAIVLLILWLALRSWKLIGAVIAQPHGRPGAHRRPRPGHGWRLQSHFGLFRRAFRRHRRGFRHPVLRSLSRRAP